MAAKAPKDYAGATDQGINTGLADADLQLKKRARRRLVGAIALALFAIIVLPVVMDHEPAPVVPDIQVRIPSPGSDGNTISGSAAQGKLAVKPLSLAGNATSTASATNSPNATNDDAATPNEPAVSAVSEPSPTVTKPMVAVAASPPSEAKPVDKAQAVAPEPPAGKSKVAAKAESTNAQAKDTLNKDGLKESVASSGASGSAASNGKWVVQLGAYQSSGNVAVLLAKLKEIRMPAYTEKFDSPQGPRTRVRAGPFASKEAALAAQKRIKIINVEGPVAPMSAK